jgi:hypothetical protein
VEADIKLGDREGAKEEVTRGVTSEPVAGGTTGGEKEEEGVRKNGGATVSLWK